MMLKVENLHAAVDGKEILKGLSLEVPAGVHSVRVQVEGDGLTLTRRLKTFFRGGETKRLQARVNGKQLVLEWIAAGRP